MRQDGSYEGAYQRSSVNDRLKKPFIARGCYEKRNLYYTKGFTQGHNDTICRVTNKKKSDKLSRKPNADHKEERNV